MSGHITRMSRGSSVGSSSSRPTSTSRSTSTWRACPWQACTCSDRSCSSSTRAWSVAAPGSALARRSACNHPSRTSGEERALRWLRSRALRWLRSERSERLETTATTRTSHRQRPLQLPRVPPQRPQQRVPDLPDRGVLGPRHRPLRRHLRQVVPERGRHLRQPQVHVAQLAERTQQLDLGDRQPGVPEQRQPRRQVEPVTAGPQPRQRLVVAYVGRRRVHPRHQPSPQLGLPGQVGLDGVSRAVGVAALAPVA